MVFIVLTGASAGIGAAAAVELTRQGHQVLATGKSPAKLAAVHERMRTAAPPGLTVPPAIPADLADLGEVRLLTEIVLDRHPRLDVLVNNAGIQPNRHLVSPDGFELAFTVNHLAPFLLTTLLAERIRASGGRVVTTSSSNHAKGHLDFSDLQMERRWVASMAYDRSKLANILFTKELRRRTGIAASSFHPGTVTTDLNRDSSLARWLKPFERYVMAAPEKGADTLVWLATDPEGAAPSAPYYYKRKPHETSAEAQDERLAARLWDVSAELVGTRT
jgi:NAD(P)-dependent dehydrogenase (short-subunit alcohol dehydrogenase family)